MIEIPRPLIQRAREAERLVVLTGAGVSAESGIPTFRQAQTGLWAQYDPAELATPEAFRRNPGLVWAWYTWRRQLARQAEPNPAHYAIAQLEELYPHFVLITQNVDRLHQRAGSRNVLELHGNVLQVRCSEQGIVFSEWEDGEAYLHDPDRPAVRRTPLDELGEIARPAGGSGVALSEAAGASKGDPTGSVEPPPRCPHCGAYLRPNVVWFGESLPEETLAQAWEEAGHGDLMLVVGTSALVQPAASLPLVALRAGATVVEVNPVGTPLTPMATYVLRGPAGEVLPLLVEQIQRNVTDS